MRPPAARPARPASGVPRRRRGALPRVALALCLAPAIVAAQAPAPGSQGAPPPPPSPRLTVAALRAAGAPEVAANDNRRAAGRWVGDTLVVTLEARRGLWRPEGRDGPTLAVYAFALPGEAPSTPGPLVRVPRGATVRATVRNGLHVPLTLHGLGERRVAADSAGTTIAPGAAHTFRFRADAEGLSYYLARTSPMPPIVRFHDDAQLHGAIVVDPAGTPRGTPATDRIFVISSWFTIDPATMSGIGSNSVLAFNGRSWPYTERLTVAQGDTARWRVVNASLLDHPLHLHGAHFRVDARGDGGRDTLHAPAARRLAVTENLRPGATIALAWTPVHAGSWVFHCHLASHIVPRTAFEADRRMPSPAARAQLAAHAEHAAHPAAPVPDLPEGMPHHMEGLVLGVTVTPRGAPPVASGPERPVRLVAHSRAAVYGEYVGYAYTLGDVPLPAGDTLPTPGPTLELVRGERVAVTMVNRAHEPIAVHWHGIELESFPDGVPGWSGEGAKRLPMVAPGDSFTVRFTPPRAGTFMFHSHANEMQQISSGLYGALIVREPGAPRDTTVDHVVLLADHGPIVNFFAPAPPVAVNGRVPAAPLVLAGGRTHRLRVINIRTENLAVLELVDADGRPVTWRVVAKDGATLAASQVRGGPARLPLFAPGEIYDVEVDAPPTGTLALRWRGIDGDTTVPGSATIVVR